MFLLNILIDLFNSLSVLIVSTLHRSWQQRYPGDQGEDAHGHGHGQGDAHNEEDMVFIFFSTINFSTSKQNVIVNIFKLGCVVWTCSRLWHS